MLAIGSGMQVLNVVCGGSLFAHVPEDVPKSILHRDPVEATLRHVLEIEEGTRLDSVYGPGEIRVNSQHHMSIDGPAEGFVVAARTPDGVIEAVEMPEHPWLVAVQWHPEITATEDPVQQRLFDRFVESVASLATPPC